MILHANENNLKELMKDGFCIVDFFTNTCNPCKMLAPILNEIESEMPFITVIKVNLSEHDNYSAEYEISAVPTLLFVNDGELCERHLGFLNKEQLKEKIGKYLYE